MTDHPDFSSIDSIRFGADADAHNRLLGIYVAWLGRSDLFSTRITREAAAGISELRFETLTGGEFLSQYLRGTLRTAHLGPTGQAFTRDYYESGAYARETADEPLFLAQDEWPVYARIAPLITRAWRRHQGLSTVPAAAQADRTGGGDPRAPADGGARILSFPGPRRR